ncbi:voltage-gated calcium channel l-type, putative [Bodo saltans]|uniref:Voltage-gated calcium channel l-type, putative n=1 Tax=Bodo saltans TaxID=75058 RepID=A0A0S4JPL3_BODSA|nr:voltage-gated calcium channel l-type, putative [Bodo saltans]|eukprot:CUG92068.1 voltage-gated calcium channel l-type, putative [Bodo saltans]
MLNHVAVIDYDGVITVQDVARSRFNAVRGLFRYICRHPLFDVFIYCCVFVNFLVMAVEEYPQSDSMEVFGSVTNIFFTSIFSLEVILRLIAESPRRYMAWFRNRFDLLVVFLSLLSLLFELIFANATFVSFFRSMRALRLLRLLRKSRRLQAVLRKFLMAMYSLTNIGGILFLVLFCYGLIGMKLFGRLVYDGTIDHNANFQNIFSAFLLMLRVATGGNWGDILYSCTQSEAQGYCLDRLGDCGINIVGQIFFLTFVVLATFVLLNVFVAVILDVFTSMTGEIDILSAWDASQFMKLWFHFDPERTYRMESRFLLTLLRHIPASCVLGMGNVPVRRRLQHELVFVESLMLEEHDGKVELQDLIHALCDRAFRKVRGNMNEETAGVGGGGGGGDDDEAGKLDPLPIERARHLKQKMDRHFRRKKRDRYKPTQCETFPVVHRVAAQIITAYWERYCDVVLPHKMQVQKAAKARQNFDSHQISEMARSVASSSFGAQQQPVGGGAGGSSSQNVFPSAGNNNNSFASAANTSRRGLERGSSDAASATDSTGGGRLRSPERKATQRSSNTNATLNNNSLVHPPSNSDAQAPLSVFDGLVDYKKRSAASSSSPHSASSSLAYRSIAPPTTGVLSTFRVLENSLSRGDRNGQHQERSVVDVLLEELDERRTALSSPFRPGQFASGGASKQTGGSIGDRLKVMSQRPDVRVWSEGETMAIANSFAAHQQALLRLSESVQFGRIAEEEDGRMRICAEESELRSLLAWRRIHDMQNVAAGGWSTPAR